MAQLELWIALLLVAFAVVPVTTLSQMLTVWLGHKLGVKPKDIENYEKATDGGESE